MPENNLLEDDQHYFELEQERQLEQSQIATAFEQVVKLFKESGEDFGNDDADSLLSADEAPNVPGFPFIIVMLALLKDLAIDAPLTFSIIGGLFSPIFSLAISIILFFWVLGKLSGGWWKKKLIRWLWLRYVIAIFIEFIPWLNIVPATTVFIIMAHYRNKKIVRLFNLALEELRGTGILKYMK